MLKPRTHVRPQRGSIVVMHFAGSASAADCFARHLHCRADAGCRRKPIASQPALTGEVVAIPCGKTVAATTLGRRSRGVYKGVFPSALHLARSGKMAPPLVNARYEESSMIVTSKCGFAEWGDIYGDSIVATALRDRLLHQAIVLQIEGLSNRLCGHRRSPP